MESGYNAKHWRLTPISPDIIMQPAVRWRGGENRGGYPIGDKYLPASRLPLGYAGCSWRDSWTFLQPWPWQNRETRVAERVWGFWPRWHPQHQSANRAVHYFPTVSGLTHWRWFHGTLLVQRTKSHLECHTGWFSGFLLLIRDVSRSRLGGRCGGDETEHQI